MGRPSCPSSQGGKSLREGASQIPGTNGSTLHQLKPPHPSHVEGPVGPRRLGLATYPNPRPSSLTIPRNERMKTTPNTVRVRTSSTCLVRVGNPAPERFAIKKPVRHSFGVLVFYLTRLLIFLQAILIPACASSSPAFLMMYSAWKLNKQGDSIQL